MVVGLLTAGASHRARFAARCGELKQLAERGRARPVQGRAHRHLGRFQIEVTRLAPFLENNPQELIYFARDLLADRFRRFFSGSLKASSSSTGRNWQIFSLTSTQVSLNA